MRDSKRFCEFDISILALGMPFDGGTIDRGSLGGSESAAVYLARALVRAGSHVTVFCNTPRAASYDGVEYCPASLWPSYARETPHDVCIVQRAAGVFAQRTNARLNVLWCHDLALGRDEAAFRRVMWNIDKTIVLSRFMQGQYGVAYSLPPEQFTISRNGVDLSLFEELRKEAPARERRKVLYAARPERGLDLLLQEIMPRLVALEPDIELCIAGYEFSSPEWKAFYQDCAKSAAKLGKNVRQLGALAKRDLYRHYLSAGLYLYPTPSPALPTFSEVSCISAMECQAAGLPIVTSASGALPETIASGAAVFADGLPVAVGNRDRYVSSFVEGVSRLLHDDAAWMAASEAGLKHAATLGWDAVAREWLAECESAIRAKNASPIRLYHHGWRSSDIMAARELARAGELAVPAERALTPWAFVDTPKAYAKHYAESQSGRDDFRFDAEDEARFSVLSEWLQERATSVQSLVDYGCAHGAYALALASKYPHLRVHGIDIDPKVVQVGSRAAKERGLEERVAFSVGRADEPHAIGSTSESGYDCALLMEILEHVGEPWTLLSAVEKRVRVGGKVFITVPTGPWEFESYRHDPRRYHVWNFDAHDLRDMLGEKPDFALNACYAGDNPLTGDPQGWWIVHYTADHRPVGRVDMARHLWLQRPKQTLSVNTIAGPGSEDTLHWMLKSVQDVADEIVIANCGMSPEALRIAVQYDVKVVAGVSPIREGFEVARNIALDASTGDWCLWIDTDERLVGGRELGKYLRDNAYQGYALRQHNFSCDLTSTPDTPVRLFRRRSEVGPAIRFWGAVHEHPEFSINAGVGATLCLPDVNIAHVGYLSEEVRRERMSRNAPLLRLDAQRYPERIIQKFFVMRDNCQVVRATLRVSGGHVTADMEALCRETISLFRQHFLGRSHPMSSAALDYYSEALTVLDEGFEVAFQIEADKSEAKAGTLRKCRVASTEELNAELRRRVAEKAGQFDSQAW
jgi:glycosyltransferase involved in cell wall biosynthesis/2-polyprenyl-3-methyl-5-hydroxy-6-metoxy-1,4-benzoquinol methylase